MKKIIYVLLTFQIIYAAMIILNIFSDYKINKLLFSEAVPISVITNSSVDQSEYFNFIEDLSSDYDISISKYIFRDDNRIIIFTTDSTLNHNVKLKNGEYIPKDNMGAFLSTHNSGDRDQLGTIKQISSERDREIVIRDFREVKNFGLDGTYYFHTQDIKLVTKLVNEINKNYGNAKIETGIGSVVEKYEFSSIINLSIITLFLIITIIYYFLGELRAISIKKINGYSLFSLQFDFIKVIQKVIIFSSLLVYFFFIVYFVIKSDFDYFLSFTILFILLALCNSILLISFALVLTLLFRNFKIIELIRGKKPYKFLTIINYITKALFTVTILVLVSIGIDNYFELDQRLNSLDDWQKTEDIFKTGKKDIGQLDLNDEQKINEVMESFYKDTERNLGAFLIDSSNFETTGDNQYVYEANGCEGVEYKPECKSIKINSNYLNYNKVSPIEGNIQEKIINDSNTINILVPIKYKNFEEEIINSYRDNFYFQKVKVENIYNKSSGLPVNEEKIENIRVNLIYVENNQSYFTYNIDTAKKDDNSIVDPVTIIDTGNVDSSFYSAYISSSLFYKSNQGDNAFNDLIPYINKYKLESTLQNVNSVYQAYGEDIANIKKEQKQIVEVLIIILISNLIVIYYIIAIYFEKNKINHFVRKINGFNMLDNIKGLLISLISVNLLAFIISSLIMKQNLLLPILIIFFLEIVFISIISNRLEKKSVNSIIKGA